VVDVRVEDYRKVWKTIAKLARKGVRLTSENVLDLIRDAGFKKNNSTIRRIIYDGINLGIIRSEFIYTGSMSLNRRYIPEKYEFNIKGYRRKLMKKIDTYLNITYEKTSEGFGFVLKCNDCGNLMISPAKTQCPICKSQNLEPVSLEEIKSKYLDLIKKLSNSELIDLASLEVEGGIPAVAERLKSMLISS